MAAAIVFVASATYFSDTAQLDIRRRVLDAEAQALRYAQTAQLMVNEAASAAAALSTVVPLAPREEDLNLAVEQLLLNHPSVSALELTHGAAVRQWIRNDSALAAQTTGPFAHATFPPPMATGRTFTRFDQGRLILALTLHQRQGAQLVLWGHAQAVIGLERLMRTLALSELVRAGYPVQLLVSDADGGQVGQIAGSPGNLPGARDQRISFPDGGALHLRVGPRGGLAPDPLLYAQLALSAIAAILLAILVHVVLRRLGDRAATSHGRPGPDTPLWLDANAVRAVLDHLPMLALLKEAGSRRVCHANVFAEALLGRETADLTTTQVEHAFAGAADAIRAAEVRALHERRAVHLPPVPIETAEGRRDMAISVVPIPGRDGQPDFLLELAEDVGYHQQTLVAAETATRQTAEAFDDIGEGLLPGAPDRRR